MKKTYISKNNKGSLIRLKEYENIKKFDDMILAHPDEIIQYLNK